MSTRLQIMTYEIKYLKSEIFQMKQTESSLRSEIQNLKVRKPEEVSESSSQTTTHDSVVHKPRLTPVIESTEIAETTKETNKSNPISEKPQTTSIIVTEQPQNDQIETQPSRAGKENSREQELESTKQTQNVRRNLKEVPFYVIGDSIVGSVRTHNIYDGRTCHIKTMPGKKLEDAAEFLEHQCPYMVTGDLVAHFGTNNLQDKAINAEELIENIVCKTQNLLNVAKVQFPKCHIHMSAILLRHDMKDVHQIIDIVNDQISDICAEDERLSFISHSDIDGARWLKRRGDGLHLTQRGTEKL